MIDLSVKYLDLKLKNPVIVGSSGLTNSVTGVVELAKAGAAAVVLKSLFEEQIINEAAAEFKDNILELAYPEAQEFVRVFTEKNAMTDYLKLIEDCKKQVDIPIIASINCVTSGGWTFFAKKIQESGADALEINLFILPTDFTRNSEDNERIYFEVIETVKKEVSIPIVLKIGYHFSNLAQMIQKLSFTGISGIVLFNRFFSLDFNLEDMHVIPANLLSNPSELTISLRWIAIMSDRVRCDLAASTGIHTGEAVVKQLLAGANAVQIVSALYQNGADYLKIILKDLENWMKKNNYIAIDEFRGQLCSKQSIDPAAYERIQFMKYYSI